MVVAPEADIPLWGILHLLRHKKEDLDLLKDGAKNSFFFFCHNATLSSHIESVQFPKTNQGSLVRLDPVR